MAAPVQLFTRTSAPYMRAEPWGGSRATFWWGYGTSVSTVAAIPVPSWSTRLRISQGAADDSSQVSVGADPQTYSQTVVPSGTGIVRAGPGMVLPIAFAPPLILDVEPASTIYLQLIPPSSADPGAGVLISVEWLR